ncbi:SDR family oxidoreductase, partial [Streptomyces sp. NPDC048411]|uniref:SDR family oxidoreductase n=1 Tax=Streptomyces sp. NPDC048411 TaxID=3157206 RepID=UPI0034517D36
NEPLPHAWHIDDREYRRQEKRRGRRFAYTSLDPARTALVVIGMVLFVHVSSIASRLPQRTEASYAAKAALNVYSRGLATEVGEHGVRVVCVLPGFVATEGAVEHLQRIADRQGVGVEDVQQQVVDHLNVPMGRPGDPEDVAEMIAFLASGRAKWLTGAEFRGDGGIIPVV